MQSIFFGFKVANIYSTCYNKQDFLIHKGDKIDMSPQKNSSDINQLIKKEKHSWLIGIIFFVFLSVAMLASSIALFFIPRIDETTIFAIIVTMTISFGFFIFTIDCIHKYKNRTDSDWIIYYIETKHLTDTAEGFELLKQATIITDSSFVLSKVIIVDSSAWTETKLLLDNQNRKFICQRGKTYSKTYNFSDIINYEVFENYKSQVKGQVGNGLIGGEFFGFGEIIVDNNMNENAKEKCKQLKLVIRLNDLECPEMTVTYFDNVSWKKSGSIYKKKKNNIQLVCATLEFILNERTLEQSSALKNTEKNPVKQSDNEQLQELDEMKEQLQRLKNLLNIGLITQDDYEQKKKQILGL